MFRFTIRELLLLTLVVGLALGWGLRERQLGPDVKESKEWQARARALEYVLESNGLTIAWSREPPVVWVKTSKNDDGQSYGVDYSSFRPSPESP